MNKIRWKIEAFLFIIYKKYIYLINAFMKIKKKKRPRVFCIGFWKTGTTSLYKAMKILGYRTIRLPYVNTYDKFGDQKFVKKIKKCNFDAFVDYPIGYSDLYKSLDEAFPNSKFVLSIRDSDLFIKSYYNYYKNCPWDISIKNEKKLKELEKNYNLRNFQITEYFKNKPGQLLVMDVTKGDGWEKLCTFLNKPIPNKPFPHKNKGRYKK